MSGPDLSLIVPCYDEVARVAQFVAAVDAWGAEHPATTWELLCVDDGSGDGTYRQLADAAAERPRLQVIRLPENRGKGRALRAGVAAAEGRVVLFLDADLAVDLSHIDPAVALVEEGADVVVGCRNVAGAAIRRRQRIPRRWLGWAYRKMSSWWLGLDVADVTCGFKAFRREVARELFGQARADRWGFDAEILHLARRTGCVVREFPVQWFHGETSAVRLHRDIWGAFAELVAARWRHRRVAAAAPAPPAPAAPRVAAGSAPER